jgi:hypothetical protein
LHELTTSFTPASRRNREIKGKNDWQREQIERNWKKIKEKIMKIENKKGEIIFSKIVFLKLY